MADKIENKKVESKNEHNHNEHSHEGHDHSHEHKPAEQKVESKKIETPKVKKTEAIAQSHSVSISKKHSMYICNFIKNKSIDNSIKCLEEVIKYKRVIPYKGEIPHRSQPGVMSGRYPINASKAFIQILKGLKGNAIVNGLDLSKTRIYYGSASWASRPNMKGGARFKRTNITLKAKEFNK